MTAADRDGPLLMSPEEQAQTQRFAQALQQAMVVNRMSQRQLSALIGIKIGTMTKYLNGEIRPLRVAIEIQGKLAHALGVTLDALLRFYLTGELVTDVTVRDVESWIRSEAGQEDLPKLMASLQEAGQRWLGGSPDPKALPEAQELEPYTWPLRELEELELSPRMREKLGLTDADLEPLVLRGEFTDELAEAFSIAANYELSAVKEAFSKREPII